MKVQSKVIVATGRASSMGGELVVHLPSKSANVVAIDTNESRSGQPLRPRQNRFAKHRKNNLHVFQTRNVFSNTAGSIATGGDAKTPFTHVQNLDRVRVVVK